MWNSLEWIVPSLVKTIPVSGAWQRCIEKSEEGERDDFSSSNVETENYKYLESGITWTSTD